MKVRIECPTCGFSREMEENRLPAGSAIATCPKCATRFRFSREHGVEKILAPKSGSQGKTPAGDEEEDIRLVASRAYEREAERQRREEEAQLAINAARCAKNSPVATNPWAQAPGAIGWFASFYQTVLRAMFSMNAFFGNLPLKSGLLRPLGFYLIICVFQTFMARIWSKVFVEMLTPEAGGDEQLAQLLAILSPKDDMLMSTLMSCGFLVLQLYVISFLMYAAYRLVAPGRATFALLFQIMAYSAAPSLLCVVPAVGSLVGNVWGFVCLACGCKAAMNLNWPKTLFGFLPLLLIFAPVLLQVLNMLRQ